MSNWTQKSCKACEGGIPPLTIEIAKENLKDLINWNINEQGIAISRIFEFKNYYRTIAFVNAIAWMAHKEKHHPDLSVSYNNCIVNYSTHAINGLSDNDFICAAKVDQIYKQGPA